MFSSITMKEMIALPGTGSKVASVSTAAATVAAAPSVATAAAITCLGRTIKRNDVRKKLVTLHPRKPSLRTSTAVACFHRMKLRIADGEKKDAGHTLWKALLPSLRTSSAAAAGTSAATTAILRVTHIATAKAGAASATTTPATSSSAATSAKAASGIAHLTQPRRNDLLVLVEHFAQLANDTRVLLVDKSESRSSVTGTTRTTDTVDIVVNVGR